MRLKVKSKKHLKKFDAVHICPFEVKSKTKNNKTDKLRQMLWLWTFCDDSDDKDGNMRRNKCWEVLKMSFLFRQCIFENNGPIAFLTPL